MNNDYLRDFVGLFFPSGCVGCKTGLVRGEDLLCARCIAGLPFLDYERDPRNPLARRLVAVLEFARTIALLRFQTDGVVRNLLHALKYGNQPEVGHRLGRLLGQRLESSGMRGQFDLIVPVPLFRSRERSRGYNQSQKFAEGIGDSLGAPVGDRVVVRHRRTSTQTRFARGERWENMRNAFRVVSPQSINGKSILVVDDVITTGATMEACSAALLPYRPRSVSAACIADVQ